MNFDTLCKFYISNHHRIKNRTVFKRYLIYSYDLLQIKRSKLKLGTITFEIKPTIINGITVTYTFEMIFSRQPSTQQSKKQLEKILSFFNWSWDFKNVFTLLISLWLIGYYMMERLSTFFKTYINASILDEEHLHLVLNQIFTLIETRPLNSSFVHHSSNILAELSLYLNLF